MVEDTKGPSSSPGCLSLCVVCHSHLSPLGVGSEVVGSLATARPSGGSLAAPRGLPGTTTSPAHPDPTAAAHPRGPRHCHQGIRGAESQARGWWGRPHSILCVHPSPAHGPAGAVGSVCAWQGHTAWLMSTAGPGSCRAPMGGLGRTSDHHRGLVNFPPVPSASSAPRIIPPLGGSLMPGLLCGRGRVLRKCVEGT